MGVRQGETYLDIYPFIATKVAYDQGTSDLFDIDQGKDTP
jgi:hypothetical protein